MLSQLPFPLFPRGLTAGPSDARLEAMAYYVYILASGRNGTLYVGVTGDIARRMDEHRQGVGSVFTKRYGVTRLVYLEAHDDVLVARQRERRLKEWKRAWKIDLIEKGNPGWNDLYDRLNA